MQPATKIVVLLTLLLTLATPSGASGRAASKTIPLVHPGYLSVGSDTTYPPMEAADINNPGQFSGADIDLANAIAHAMGLKGARIVVTNFDSIIPSLQRRNFDVIMSSMNDTPDRRKQISFVDYMKLNAAQAILVNKSSSIHVKDYSGLCGHSVSVESGTVELDGLKAADKKCSRKITIKSYTKDTDAFQAFAAGHVESYTTDLPVALYYLKQHGSAIRMAGSAFGSGGYYGIGLLKTAGSLRSAIVRALGTIHKDGQYAKILKKWGLSSTAM